MNHIDFIHQAYDNRSDFSSAYHPIELKETVHDIIAQLDAGILRVAEKINGKWVTHEWIKKAILLYFRLQKSHVQKGDCTFFYDKIPAKFTDPQLFEHAETRLVPPAMARFGSYIGKQTVIMPSYVNIGAYVDDGTMIDTWASVGSCAQIGKNVHLSGGAGIGGILEPPQARPTIVEDNCFIGARSEVVEGVIVEEGSVLTMGVYISQSTKIYNRNTGEITYGVVPKGSVVVPGNLPAKDGSHSLYCAVIVKTVDDETRKKVSLNELLRLD